MYYCERHSVTTHILRIKHEREEAVLSEDTTGTLMHLDLLLQSQTLWHRKGLTDLVSVEEKSGMSLCLSRIINEFGILTFNMNSLRLTVKLGLRMVNNSVRLSKEYLNLQKCSYQGVVKSLPCAISPNPGERV